MSLKIAVLTTVSMSISNKEQPSSLLKLIVIQGRMFRQFRTLTYIWRTAGRTVAYGVRRQRTAYQRRRSTDDASPMRSRRRPAAEWLSGWRSRLRYIRRWRRRTAGRTAERRPLIRRGIFRTRRSQTRSASTTLLLRSLREIDVFSAKFDGLVFTVHKTLPTD